MTHETTTASLTVAGQTRGKGRPRFVKHSGRTYTPDATKVAELRVRDAWILADRPDLGDGPISIGLLIVIQRPQDHFRTNGQLSTKALRNPIPVKKPDVDNVLKLVADSLNGLAYGDDAQISSGHFSRRWTMVGEREHLEVTLRCVGPRQARGAAHQRDAA